MTSFETRRISDDHVRIIATTKRGRVYAITWAATEGSEPSDVDIRDAWENDRRAWMPFNESAGCYCG